MSRWAPNARERLQSAAWELFSENGYDETTVAQIAERAGLNRATFFRHFADKREILFGGEDKLESLFVDAIRAAPPNADAAECLEAALVAAGAVMTSEQRGRIVQRRRAAETSVEVQERGLAKNATITEAITRALCDRGSEEPAARLGAQMVMLAFAAAAREWLEAGNSDDFPRHAITAFAVLRDAALRLGGDGSRSPSPTRPHTTRSDGGRPVELGADAP